MTIKGFEKVQDKYGDIPGERGVDLRRRMYSQYFLRFGRDVFIPEGCRFHHPDRIVLEDDARFNIGAIVYGSGGVWIGRHARIGPNCFIHSANHDISESELAYFERGHVDAAVRVGNNVLISANVSILPGADIKDHTFIGCGAVVTKGHYPANSKLFGVPVKAVSLQTQQQLKAAPELAIYAQTTTFQLLAKHLLSCLGLPQIAVFSIDEELPESVHSVLLIGEDVFYPALSEDLKVWSFADGSKAINDPNFPHSRKFNYAYAGRVSSADSDSKLAQSFFWLIARLEKSPGKLSVKDMHEWLKLLSLVEFDITRNKVLLDKLLPLLHEKCPIGFRNGLNFENASTQPQLWAQNAEKKVFNKIKNKKWQLFIKLITTFDFFQTLFSDAIKLKTTKPFKGVAGRLKSTIARLASNSAAIRLTILQNVGKSELDSKKRVGDIARNPKNGQELLAAAIYAHINKMPDESWQLDNLLESVDWTSSGVAFVRSKKQSTGFCYSPLTIAWLYLQACTQKPDYQLPEHAGLTLERIEPLNWRVFENGRFVDPDKKLVSRALLENWHQLHSANCPVDTQFVLEETSYQASTKSIEDAWIDIFKTIQHTANLPFIRVKPWPTGYKAAMSLRYDVDRPVANSRITELVRLQAKHLNAACATWYYFDAHPDIKKQTKYLKRHWQETGIHLEQNKEANIGFGVTHHSAPTSNYWCGDRTNQDLKNIGASYCEFMASSLHTPRPAWHSGVNMAIGNTWVTPLHFPLEGSTRDVDLTYFDKLLPYFRAVINGEGHAIIGSHPDLNQNILIQLLQREGVNDIWFANVRDVVDRCKQVMAYGEIYITSSEYSHALCSKDDIADLSVEYWRPEDTSPQKISLQLKANKPRLIQVSK